MFKIHEWADKFLSGPKREMTREEASDFVQISFSVPPTLTTEEITKNPDLPLGAKILLGRMQAVGLSMSGQLFLFIVSLCDSPGTLVMWTYALRSWQVRNGVAKVDLDHFSRQLFPLGIPTEEGLSAAWAAQKGGDFNWLDRTGAEAFAS